MVCITYYVTHMICNIFFLTLTISQKTEMIKILFKTIMNWMPPESHKDTGFYFNDASS